MSCRMHFSFSIESWSISKSLQEVSASGKELEKVDLGEVSRILDNHSQNNNLGPKASRMLQKNIWKIHNS